MRRIAIVMAMADEAGPLVERLGLSSAPDFGDPSLPFRHFSGVYQGCELLLTTAGIDPRHQVDNIGTVPAAVGAYVTLSRFKPELCLNAGTAGGFRERGGEIGDVYVSDRPFTFHDRRIAIPGFREYGVGSYPPARIEGLAEAIGAKKGHVSTGDSLDHTSRCLETMKAHATDAKEMEAAAIAWVCFSLGVPFIALKAITDIVDGEHPTVDEFQRNLERASKMLAEKTYRALEFMTRSQAARNAST